MKMRIQSVFQLVEYRWCSPVFMFRVFYVRFILSQRSRCSAVNTAALSGASQLVTVPRRRRLSRSELIIASTYGQQQQQQHHSNTNPHYNHSITANMADKMEVDAVASEKQVEASGPAPEKPAERSTYTTAILHCDGLLTDRDSHNRQLRPPRSSC